LDHLCLLSTDKERRKALETLPKDLFETYRRILDRVNNSTVGNQRLVEKTLRWIVFSQQRLTAQAIATAVRNAQTFVFSFLETMPDVHLYLDAERSLLLKFHFPFDLKYFPNFIPTSFSYAQF
jgi:hypothetical protein